MYFFILCFQQSDKEGRIIMIIILRVAVLRGSHISLTSCSHTYKKASGLWKEMKRKISSGAGETITRQSFFKKFKTLHFLFHFI